MKLTKKYLLGKGTFSEVYLERDMIHDKSYAIKIIYNSKMNEKLQNEYNILKDIQHQNIIKLYYKIKFQDCRCLCLEYCNGGLLYDNLAQYKNKKGKPFPENLVQNIMKKILSGVQYLHNHGIIHGDLKLQNMLLKYKNDIDAFNQNLFIAEVKIIDFKSSYKGDILGGISPINFFDDKIDIWSLGNICYEMLFGKPLFSNMEQMINNILSGGFYIDKTISVQARKFLYCMLQKDRTKRLNADQLLNHVFITGDYLKFEQYNNGINIININSTNKLNNSKSHLNIHNNYKISIENSPLKKKT